MKTRSNIAQLMKNAILFGMGMAIDLSGNAAFIGPPLPPQVEMIGHDFKKVGDYLQSAIQVEAPRIEKEIAVRKAQQLQFNV
jgi:hypothetical protein